jgi:hypothetical protein
MRAHELFDCSGRQGLCFARKCYAHAGDADERAQDVPPFQELTPLDRTVTTTEGFSGKSQASAMS